DPEMAARGRYLVPRASLEKPVELWPRLHRRPLPLASLPFHSEPGKGPGVARNVRKLFDAFHLRGGRPLPRRLAGRLVTLAHRETLEEWLASLPAALADGVQALVEPEDVPLPRRRGARVPDSLTYARTARRPFEVAYWKTIAALSEGTHLNK